MEKEKIYYKQVLAGALLKFKELDVVEMRLIIDELLEANIGNIYYSTGAGLLCGYIKDYLSDIFALDKPLNYLISDKNCTLEEFLDNLQGNILKDYFDKLDIKKLKEKKKAFLKEQRDLVINSSNILLISDNDEDYKALLNYGFKNIDYFKSIIRADKYFNEHPKELEKYHIILTGEQSVKHCCLEGHVDIEDKIFLLRRRKNIIESSLHTYPALQKISIYLGDNKTSYEWQVDESSYDKVFDKLVECASLNQIIDINSLEKFVPIEDYINSNKLALPTKKNELKILCLVTHIIDESHEELAKSLGLNITFKHDSNAGLGKYVKRNLGDYDIIIASDLHSSPITSMGIESTEQCKDTGRDLTLLMKYKDSSTFSGYCHNEYSIYANNVNLSYTYGGNLAPNLYLSTLDYTTLIPNASHKNDSHINYLLEKMHVLKTIIESAVNIYNNALKQTRDLEIEDLNFMKPEDYTTEYKDYHTAIANKKKLALKPLHDFDDFTTIIYYYLKYKKEGLIYEEIPGLNIIELEETITVENVLNGRILCSINYQKNYYNSDSRIFTIQSLNKKGNLGQPELVGLYTTSYEKTSKSPKKIDERQSEIMEALYKKVRKIVQPLNNIASEKYHVKNNHQKRLIKKGNN